MKRLARQFALNLFIRLAAFGNDSTRQRDCGQRPRRILQAAQEEQGAEGGTTAGDSRPQGFYAVLKV